MNTSILVMEDDTSIQELIVEFLKAEGYDVNFASDGLEGIQLFKKKEYDLVLLDIMMPNLDGYAVCKMIRQNSNVPIIFLTALNEETAQLKGFELECDDYITKPFSFNLLIQRVKAVLRRGKNHLSNDFLIFEKIRLDLNTYSVQINDKNIELTKNEVKILSYLINHKGEIVSREILMEHLWNSDFFVDDSTLTVNITRLRKKLDEIGIKNVIETRRGLGYIMR